MITENLSTLKIHKLTQAQYERELAAGRIEENAMYLTPNEEYYTEAEIDEKISQVNESIENIVDGITVVSEAKLAAKADLATVSVNAELALKDTNGNVIIQTYETKSDASSKLNESKTYTDEAKTDVLSKVVSKTGDTMTGDLTISKNGTSGLKMFHANGKGGAIQQYNNALTLTEYESFTALTNGNYRRIKMENGLNESDVANALVFQDKKSGDTSPTTYPILHSGNFSNYAVDNTGDTMTGDLTIEKSSPVLNLKNSSGRTGLFNMGTSSMYLRNQLDSNNRSTFMLNAETGNLNTMLRLSTNIEGSSKTYNVLHTGNASALGYGGCTTGSYTGTGTGTKSITVPSGTKMLVVQGNVVDANGEYWSYGPVVIYPDQTFVMINGHLNVPSAYQVTGEDYNVLCVGSVTYANNVFTITSIETKAADMQALNEENCIYHWFAFT